jgi:hypothetical protein
MQWSGDPITAMERLGKKQLNHAKITERPIDGEERQRRAELRRQTSPRFF